MKGTVMPTTDNSIHRRHEKKHFTPAEVISALQYIGAMSPIELLTAGYINIPAVNDGTPPTSRAQIDAALAKFEWTV